MTSRHDKLGPVTVPLSTSSAGATLVTYADPTLTDLLAKFKDLLNDKLASAWNLAAGAASPRSFACDGTYLCNPQEIFSRGWKWPALFMWRERERLFNRTQVYRCAETQGQLMYVLPPYPYEIAIKLLPVRTAARTALDLYIEQFGDPDVDSAADPVNANSLEWFTFTSAEYMMFGTGDTANPHPALLMGYSMRERQSFVSANYSALSRIDTTVKIMTEGSGSSSTTLVTTYYDPTS